MGKLSGEMRRSSNPTKVWGLFYSWAYEPDRYPSSGFRLWPKLHLAVLIRSGKSAQIGTEFIALGAGLEKGQAELGSV